MAVVRNHINRFKFYLGSIYCSYYDYKIELQDFA